VIDVLRHTPREGVLVANCHGGSIRTTSNCASRPSASKSNDRTSALIGTLWGGGSHASVPDAGVVLMVAVAVVVVASCSSEDPQSTSIKQLTSESLCVCVYVCVCVCEQR
jgi:hypothetical protein